MGCRMKTSTVVIVVSVMVAALAGGCGSGTISEKVDMDKLKDMSRQGRLWIYDAENEIVVALDKLDEAKDHLSRIRRQIKRAQRGVERAEKRKNRLGVQVAEAWLAHLEAMEDWAEENIDLQRIGVLVALATVELAKAQVINREDLLGGKDFDMKDYKEQYESFRQEYIDEISRIKKLRQRARKREKKWWKLRQSFVAETGDYDSGLWIE